LPTVALDSSAMLSLVLQEPSHWQVIDRLISNPAITLVLPGPVLAEVIYTARRKGKRTAANLLAQTLFANGIRVVHPIDEYLIRAAELHEIASAPGGTASGRAESAVSGRRPCLSPADAQILAIVERLAIPIVTRDNFWYEFVAAGHTSVRVVVP
jgi:predicted nucleic acid-binding protein